MTTRTTTRTTRNSTNAGTNPEVAFGRRITPRATSNRHNSDQPATNNPGGGDNPDGDDHGNDDGPEDDLPGDPDNDPPDDDLPDDDNPDDNPDNDVQNNLADAIAALARNVRHQGDGSRSKVREPDPFDGTDPTKLRTFLVQLQLSFNDRPRAFNGDRKKSQLCNLIPQGHRTCPLREFSP